MTTLMAKAADMAEVVLIQEPAVRWVADVRGGNLGHQDTGGGQERGVAYMGEAVGAMVGVGKGFQEWVGGVGVG
jgi:hypothetical protein